ncbi:DedA family protein [Haladaptatus sp. AB643]|uniref:DedA family protein n=1 Tax=Haladaptatus sp. AB643 TaxID=2934174 RepID=UPI00209C1C6D|nr:DedA family protein [Haladaptatus sp. AB643]MCO8245322.1 DedA family protein [Haladaptatus sp. AB643]
MFDWLTHSILSFVSHYGYVAVFVYMILETAFILHFAPSEIVVPFAATQLVHDPISFGLFVLDATAGATVGSILAYYLLGKQSDTVLSRYGYLIHVSEDDIQRGRHWFRRWGESSVFWGRMLPLMRAVISIPAGIAEMDLRKFVAYSASGSFIFNIFLTFLVYSGAGKVSPLGWVLQQITPELTGMLQQITTEFTAILTYVQLHPRVVIIATSLVMVAVGSLWMKRDYIQQNPTAAQRIILHVLRGIGSLVGGLFLVGATDTPRQSFRTITSIWNDPLSLTHLGLSPQMALILTGVAFLGSALAIFELGKRVPIAKLVQLIWARQFFTLTRM